MSQSAAGHKFPYVVCVVTDPRTNRLSNVPHHLVRNPTWREIFSIFYDSVVGQRDSMGRKMAVFQSLTLAGLGYPAVKTTPSLYVPHPSYAVEIELL